MGGGDFIRGYNNMLQYAASEHPNADAIITTSEKRHVDASETVNMQLTLGLSDTARYMFNGA
jgi:hypothetical protein